MTVWLTVGPIGAVRHAWAVDDEQTCGTSVLPGRSAS